VIRVRRSLVIGSVATVTVRGQRGVVVVHVTVRAGDAGVCASEREAGIVMVESGRRPGSGAVAYVALLREPGRHVTGIFSPLEVLKVTIHASRAREVVVAVGMALGALYVDMCAGERPSGRGMVEGRAGPIRRAVTNLALLRESRRGVIGIGRSLIVLQMAGDTCRTGKVKVSVCVTLFALQLRVPSCQWEPYRIVIEVCRLPRRRVVALLAALRQSQRYMVRIARFLVVRQVAAYAGCRSALILPANVARRALQRRVHSS